MTAAVPAFRFHLPVAIRFGAGVAGELPEVLAELGAGRALAVVEAPVRDGAGGVAELLAACAAGVHEKPVGEPSYAMVTELAERIASERPDALVAIGGGATMDTVKAARVEAELGAPFADVVSGERPVPHPVLPVVAVPTTSGTGSEVTGAAVISHEGRKLGTATPRMRVQHALVDPELTLSLPSAPTRDSGVDALAQAIGGVIVTNSSPGSVAVGLEACRYAGRGLRRAVADGSDREARELVAAASLMAGLSINLADCAADHALAHAIGGHAHLPHGLAVGLVLAETLEVNLPACRDRLQRVADALDEPAAGPADGSGAVRAVRRLLRDVGLPTASECGLGADGLDALVPLALDDYCLTTNPHTWSAEDVRGAYRAAFALAER